MDEQDGIRRARALMESFAERTGLDSARPQRRYLWTDAFAVGNFLALEAATDEARFRELALRLVDRVHRTLGRHRPDDPRAGTWLSGLDEREGAAHPTQGGLRIGKKRPERARGERFDERLEWERDGQYFHYLTQWMRALDELARVTGDGRFNLWGRELAQVAVRAFSRAPPGGGPPRLVWKMSVDLSRPLVPSMGQHDALDGYLACIELEATAARMPPPVTGPRLGAQAQQLAAMFAEQDLGTDDPLGLGGLMLDAFRVHRLVRDGVPVEEGLLLRLLGAAGAGLAAYARRGELLLPAEQRLAFRELGLAIGLHAAMRMTDPIAAEDGTLSAEARARLRALGRHADLAQAIEAFWLDPTHRRAGSFAEHQDINEVMLATSLLSHEHLDAPRR